MRIDSHLERQHELTLIDIVCTLNEPIYIENTFRLIEAFTDILQIFAYDIIAELTFFLK